MLEKKHNYFYRITNQINWKFYYGIHSTNNINDSYMGSGKLLKDAIKKYGKENFVKTVIADYPTRKEASDHEKEAVTHFQINDENCYNCRFGGDNENSLSLVTRKKISEFNIGKHIGELNHFFGKTHTEESNRKNSEAHLGKSLSEEHRNKIKKSIELRGGSVWKGVFGEDNPNFGRKHSEEFSKQISERQKGENNSFFGKPHSEESKKMISEANRGERNSFYGKSHSPEVMKQILLNNPQRKPCVIEGVEFLTKTEVKNHFKISESVLNYRLTSTDLEWINWNYLK